MLCYIEKGLFRCDYIKDQHLKEGDVMMKAEVEVICFEDRERVH